MSDWTPWIQQKLNWLIIIAAITTVGALFVYAPDLYHKGELMLHGAGQAKKSVEKELDVKTPDIMKAIPKLKGKHTKKDSTSQKKEK